MKFLALVVAFFMAIFPAQLAATEDVDYLDNIEMVNAAFDMLHGVTVVEGKLVLAGGSLVGKAVSPATPTKIEFNALSISWRGDCPFGSGIDVECQALGHAGIWSDWRPIGASDGDLQWDSPQISYRFRISLRADAKGNSPCVQNLVVFYNSLKKIELPREDATTLSRGISKPYVAPRSEWGARPPNGSYSSHTPVKITIHHTWRPTAAQYAGASTVRSVQNYHMDNNGWMDIGYHFLIGTYPQSGETKIWQGRPENVLGAHTGGANTGNVGVNVVGDYMVETIHGNSYKALIDLLAWICDRYKISPDAIYGHRDLGNSSCPGDKLYNLLPQIRRDVRNKINGTQPTTGTLTGVIYNAAEGTGSRIAGATVTLGTGQKTMSDSNGIYKFELAPGSYSITVEKAGYLKGSGYETVSAQQTVWESIGLRK